MSSSRGMTSPFTKSRAASAMASASSLLSSGVNCGSEPAGWNMKLPPRTRWGSFRATGASIPASSTRSQETLITNDDLWVK